MNVEIDIMNRKRLNIAKNQHRAWSPIGNLSEGGEGVF